MITTKKWIAAVSSAVLVGFALAGCGTDAPPMTKAQEEGIRHPTADPNWHGQDAQAVQRMGQSVADFRKKHENDKVEFR